MVKSRYGNYPRKPITDLDKYSDNTPYTPRINKGVIEEQTIRNKKGDTEIIGNAPNVNYLKKKGYKV